MGLQFKRIHPLFPIFAFLIGSAFLSGQTITTGDVAGVVTDSSGAVVPGAVVRLASVDNPEDARTETSKDQGEYRFSLLKPGQYTISAEKGSLKSNVEKFTVALGEVEQMNLTTNVQGTQQMVQVTTEASALETENANLATSFTKQQIDILPAPGGDITTLAFTVPGVRVNVGGGSANFNANGVPGVSNLFTLNGADIMDPFNNYNNSGASNNTLGQNEVSEAAVVLNAYDAQYGRMAGAQVNFVGRSGTKGFHGNLFYNYNGSVLNANDFFKNLSNTPRSRSDANQYGASLGGPIWKNKTFFYTDYESLRYVLPATGVVSLPTQQFENYTLSHIPAASVPLYQDAFNLYNSAPGVSRAIPVTTGNGPLQDSTGNLGCQSNGTFKGTLVPGTSGQQFGVNVPCAQAFETSVNEFNVESLFIARVDHNLNDKQKLNFRYEYDWGLQATGPSVVNPVFNSQSTQPQHAGQATYTYVINPNLVNNFIGSASWYSAIFGVASFSKAQAAMPEEFTFADGGANGSTGLATVGASIPYGRNVGQAQIVDDLSWIKGAHALKFGANYRYNKVTDTQIGRYTQEGTYTFNDLTDFAIGQVNSTGLGTNFSQAYAVLQAAHIRLYSLGFYAQDEWSVNKWLKLSYGIRFERDENPACADNCFSRLNTPFNSPSYQGSASTPYNSSITTGLGNEYPAIESIIPEPRFGFVVTPFGSNKTVIRGGVGLFASLFAASTAESVFDNIPNKFQPTVPSGIVSTTGVTGSSPTIALASYNAFENGYKQGFTLAQIQSALTAQGVKFAIPNIYSTPGTFNAPKALEWSLEIEQPITNQDVLAVTYAGNHGYNEPLTNNDANGYLKNTNYYPAGFAGLPLTPPDPRFVEVSQALTDGVSNYDGLTVQLRHTFTYGFQGQIGYTYSHALGDVGVYNPFSLNAGYGSLAFDTRHALTSDLIWNIPFKSDNRILSTVLGGWTVSNKLYLYSGRPFAVTNSKLNSTINSTSGYLANTVLSDVLVPSAVNANCGSQLAVSVKCITASEFATTAATTGAVPGNQLDFGNVSPDSFRGPGYFDMDTALTKTVKFAERTQFTFGAQAYNLTNHVNLSVPTSNVTSGGLGLISADVVAPTSIYGAGEGASVSGRVMVVMGRVTF